MFDRIKEIWTSYKFWIATLSWGSQYLAIVSENGFDLTTLFVQLSIWFGIVGGIGFVDGVAERVGGIRRKK